LLDGSPYPLHALKHKSVEGTQHPTEMHKGFEKDSGPPEGTEWWIDLPATAGPETANKEAIVQMLVARANSTAPSCANDRSTGCWRGVAALGSEWDCANFRSLVTASGCAAADSTSLNRNGARSVQRVDEPIRACVCRLPASS
jgi:hypothetical protein